jgi:tetratricopeptide (TPR) repeat protein
LRDELSKVVRFGGFDDPKTTLAEALDQLAKRYHVAFDVYDAAFKAEQIPEVLKTEVAQPPIPEMTATLATVLKKVLARIPVPSHAVYLIRGDTIEITTGQVAQSEKAIRVYPVADLVIPIPPPGQFVQQNLLNQTGAVGVGGGFNFGGGGFNFGGGGFNFGGGGFNFGGGGFNFGGGGFNFGGGGFNFGGGGFNFGGGFNIAGGAFNAGGGFMGGNFNAQFGGQFQGNFNGPQGNTNFVGGFGLQNNNQSRVLITLIRQVIAPKTWSAPYNPITGLPLDPLQMGNDPAAAGQSVDPNSLGFYPPAMALVVSAPTRIYVNDATRPVLGGAAGGGMGALERDRRGTEFVRIDGSAPPLAFRPPRGGTRDDPKAPRLDPRSVWQDALAKAPASPGLVIAVSDFLAMNQEWEHAAEFLKANLRQGIVVKPWVYEALALALREAGGSPEEVERAEVSAADLQPQNAQSFQHAAHAMADLKRYDRAVAFSRQAALLQPGAPLSYSEALIYAELAHDSQAMEWAAGSLLKQDWPYHNDELQKKAVQKLESLARALEKDRHKDEAERLLDRVHQERQRDLVIKMSYQGEADLDLKVKGPCGIVCSALNRQTVGGAILIGDALAEMSQETYLVAQAFPGDYEVTVERIWGQPQGNRAQLKIIRHQGTPQQEEELVMVDLKANHPIKVRLKEGRRTETAYVAPQSALQTEEPMPMPESTGTVLNELRKLADPEITGVTRGIRGGVYSSGTPRATPAPTKAPVASKNDRLLFQNRVEQVMGHGVDLTAQAVLSADRRSIRLSMTPMFEAAQLTPPTVTSPLIPGAP